MPSDAAIRVSDAEREAVVTALAEHHAAGRLSLDELEERVGVGYRAVTRADLDAVLADLPRRQQVRSRPVPRASCSGGGASWAPWLTAGIICLVVWMASSMAKGDVVHFWPIWVIGPWGAVMVFSRLRLPERRVRPGNG